MSSRSLLLPGLLLVTSACSSASGSSPGDFEGADAEAEAAVVPGDGADPGEPSSDASTSPESGPASANPPEAGTADAGSVFVACDQPALGVCQTATVSTDMEPSWRAQCTSQGGTADACPAAGLVGCCVGDTSHYCYYSVDFSVSDAQKNCSFMNGTWSATM